MKTENVKMKLKMIKTSSCTAPSYCANGFYVLNPTDVWGKKDEGKNTHIHCLH